MLSQLNTTYLFFWLIISFFISVFHYILNRKYFVGISEKGQEAFVLSQAEVFKKKVFTFVGIWVGWSVIPFLIFAILYLLKH